MRKSVMGKRKDRFSLATGAKRLRGNIMLKQSAQLQSGRWA